ncbi:HAD family hydrolase [Prochlorococcus sp. MIT 1300]|uniref:HAD family hydrolase n=1 Tax=Prochlorococcus sp. MIT 1300 TaxID=3096218 RepID=UPI002A74BD5D|nr:HAD family hydrolase [Prochlorococcus sp. MIT 1300]
MASPSPLLVFDFDGVIVDGMLEYWWSARKACIDLLGAEVKQASATSVPKSFRQLRPWVNHGWEMVLIATEILRPESSLARKGIKDFANNYKLRCKQALEAQGWTANQLQAALENVRQQALTEDKAHWLDLHKPFPIVVKHLQSLRDEGIELVVLTTKGTDFTHQLLQSFHLKTSMLFGHEAGSKAEVLLQLSLQRSLLGFVEDRRETLEKILQTPGLTSLACYLANWGYLKPEDCQALPDGIQLLKQETLTTPLATWT